jgi:hypothetical protein
MGFKLVVPGLGESRIAAKRLETTCGPRVSERTGGTGTCHTGWWAGMALDNHRTGTDSHEWEKGEYIEK